MSEPARRVRALVHGHVQGVGFRLATLRRARALRARGWVRNRPDGLVECVLEGSRDSVAGMLEFLGTGPPGAHVSRVDTAQEDATGLPGFEISPDAEPE